MKAPKDINQAIEMIEMMMDEEAKKKFIEMDELEASYKFHFNIGLSIRNLWIYNNNDWLKEAIPNFDPFYVDDYSNKLIQLCHRKLNNKKLNSYDELMKVNWIAREFGKS